MSRVIDIDEGRLFVAARRGYRNWIGCFKEEFGLNTKLSHLSAKTISSLAQGKEQGSFYLYDFIMNVNRFGSGFDFNNLPRKKKMAVIDQYLFLLDRIRFECMKRLKWIESYPGEEYTLVELITRFEELGPSLHAKVPLLSPNFPGYKRYCTLDTLDKEVFIRKLIPRALEEIQDYSTSL